MAHEPAADARFIVPRRHRVEGAVLPRRGAHKERIEKGNVIADDDRALFFERAPVFLAHDAAAVRDLQKDRRDELQHRAENARRKPPEKALTVLEIAVRHKPIMPEGDIIVIEPAVAFQRRLNAVAQFEFAHARGGAIALRRGRLRCIRVTGSSPPRRAARRTGRTLRPDRSFRSRRRRRVWRRRPRTPSW